MQRLHQNIVCAELLKLLQQMRLAMTTEYDHPRRPGLALPPALQRSENLEPVHLRHPQIEQHRRRFRPDCSRIKGAEHRHLSEGPRSRLRAVSLAGSAVRRRLGHHGRLKDGVGGGGISARCVSQWNYLLLRAGGPVLGTRRDMGCRPSPERHGQQVWSPAP